VTHRAYPILCALFSPILRYWKLFRLTVPEHCACDGDSLHMSPTQWFSTTVTVTQRLTHMGQK
jgi:hypothetical protein